jgi:hypothetical protein
MTGDELEHWQLESVLRRAAQVLGQWVGMNHETLSADAALRFSSMGRAREPHRPDGNRTG